MAKRITPISKKYLHVIPRQPPPDPLKDPGAYFQWAVTDARNQMHNWAEPVRNASGSMKPSGIGNDRGGIMGEFTRWQDEWQKSQKNKQKNKK